MSCFIELCGTPGYLAPEILKCSMDDMHAGYGKEVDLWVLAFVVEVKKAPMPSHYFI